MRLCSWKCIDWRHFGRSDLVHLSKYVSAEHQELQDKARRFVFQILAKPYVRCSSFRGWADGLSGVIECAVLTSRGTVSSDNSLIYVVRLRTSLTAESGEDVERLRIPAMASLGLATDLLKD